ncbi:MAG: SAM-dependent methyltransferase, partial [Spirochaetes bacterium]|nr:SAM-dependent methyltransferase [Spirochaetota bacterium]
MMKAHPSSFRDPQGFIFEQDGVLYRQVNESCRTSYERLMGSGLYDELVAKLLLVPHVEVDAPRGGAGAYRILKPDLVPFISYPYEWSFGQLKKAALTTLRIQRIALRHDMTLRDSSAFNVQFVGSRPVFIDTLSFESYV